MQRDGSFSVLGEAVGAITHVGIGGFFAHGIGQPIHDAPFLQEADRGLFLSGRHRHSLVPPYVPLVKSLSIRQDFN